MSDQGPIPDRCADDFSLIETLLWTRDGGFDLLPEHLARLAASSAALGFAHDEKRVRAALAAAVSDAENPRLRVRLVLSRDGAIETGAAPIDATPPDTIWRVALAQRRFSSSDPLLRHKTTRRALYEDELAEAAKRRGADEVLFLNERGELCEGARANVFLKQDGALLTPPLSCGLLPGVLRANLLASRRAREESIRILARLGISESRLGRPLEQMSRGMQQKVAIARAILTSPTLLLLDEPTTGLDPRSKLDVQTFVEELRDHHDATIVLTTHDLAEADRLCDRIGILDSGRLITEGTPEQLKDRMVVEHGLPPTLESVFMTYTGRSLDDDVDEEDADDHD